MPNTKASHFCLHSSGNSVWTKEGTHHHAKLAKSFKFSVTVALQQWQGRQEKSYFHGTWDSTKEKHYKHMYSAWAKQALKLNSCSQSMAWEREWVCACVWESAGGKDSHTGWGEGTDFTSREAVNIDLMETTLSPFTYSVQCYHVTMTNTASKTCTFPDCTIHNIVCLYLWC